MKFIKASPLQPKNSPAANVSHGFPVSQTRSMRVLALWTYRPTVSPSQTGKTENTAEKRPRRPTCVMPLPSTLLNRSMILPLRPSPLA